MWGLVNKRFALCFSATLGVALVVVGCAAKPSREAAVVNCQPPLAVPCRAPLPSRGAALQVGWVAGKSAPASVASSPRALDALPTQFLDLTRQQVIELALHDSRILRDLGGRILDAPQSAMTRYDYALQRSDPFYGPQAALSQFDTVLNSSVMTAKNDRVFNNIVLGGGAQELLQDTVSLQAGLSRRLPGGGVVSINRRIDYDSNNRAANLFPSIWETQLEVGVRQPLLRGAGRRFNAIAGPNAQPGFVFSNGIVIARMNSSLSQLEFERGLQDFLSDVEDAYWTLQLAYREYEGQRQARDAAYQTWQSINAKYEERLEGGEADKEAQARSEYLLYQQRTLEALNGTRRQTGVYESERRLRYLVGLPASDERLLRPIEQVSTAPVVYDWEALLSTALQRRIDLRQQALRVHQEELRLVAAKNFLLPQVDLIGRHRLRGFGNDLAGEGSRFSGAFNDFYSLEHQEWEFGLEMQVAAGRRQARAAVQNAQLKVQRERAVWEQQQRLVAHELSEAVARVEVLQAGIHVAGSRMEAADRRRQAAAAQYAAGHTTVHLLLNAQEDFIAAQQRFIETTTDYAMALKNVSLASGALLSDLGIQLAEAEHFVDVQIDWQSQSSTVPER